MWALRCYHEASQHRDNCFLTLTYNDMHLPKHGTLVPDHFTNFMKRLRKKIEPVKIRFYGCGEYGEKTSRPHYHNIIFGYDFPDKKLHKVSPRGDRLYTSDLLNSIWTDPQTKLPIGHALIGDVTFESAAYVARYCTKKINGEQAATHYQKVDPDTGEIIRLVPEFPRMSRRPGIGRNWLEHYTDDVYNGDFCEVRGKKLNPPKYYDKVLEQTDPKRARKIKAKRKLDAKRFQDNNTPERLAVRERIQIRKQERISRSYEQGNAP